AARARRPHRRRRARCRPPRASRRAASHRARPGRPRWPGRPRRGRRAGRGSESGRGRCPCRGRRSRAQGRGSPCARPASGCPPAGTRAGARTSARDSRSAGTRRPRSCAAGRRRGRAAGRPCRDPSLRARNEPSLGSTPWCPGPCDVRASIGSASLAAGGSAARALRLDIEHVFGMMPAAPPPWESRVTRHDADRKLKILHYIAATLRARGYPPSVREIALAVGLSSTSAVHHHLQMLEREGYLERGAAQSRAIRLTPTAAIQLGLTHELVPQAVTAEAHVLPVIGEIAAGGPIEAYQDASETMAVPDVLAPSGDAYVLRVRGDSMIEAHIADGDFVLIRPQTTARNGDIVVAQVEENAVTLKRFFKEKDQTRLQPANPAYPPQFYDDVRIQGKLIGVIRRLD